MQLPQRRCPPQMPPATTAPARDDRPRAAVPQPVLIAFITNEFPTEHSSCVALRPGLNRDAPFTAARLPRRGLLWLSDKRRGVIPRGPVACSGIASGSRKAT